MRFHRFFTLALGAAALAACESTTSPRLAGVGGTLTGSGSTNTPLVITPNQIQLSVGTTAQLSTNASTGQQGQLQWSSSQTSVASVTSTGLVTGFGAGTATISVRVSSDTTNVATATVVVGSP